MSTGRIEAALCGAFCGACAALAVAYLLQSRQESRNIACAFTQDARERLPRKIILVRHGESEANADHSLWRTKADHRIELTDKGSAQAINAGKRIKKIIGDMSVSLYVSPFARTLQTARNLREAFEENIVHTHVEPRVREQEFGNLQGDDFKNYRGEQLQLGRFFYRFPTGESGADVYARVKQWWDNTLLPLNHRNDAEPVDAIVVVTHGLTMRLILMQLYGWSPQTFETVWNAGNCDIYVLEKDLEAHGKTPYRSPYVLDPTQGDQPMSSIELMVHFKDGSEKQMLLKDYLSIPAPRTRQHTTVCKMLGDQHSIDPSDIDRIDYSCGKFKKYK